MKKLLGIVVLGLMFCSTANAGKGASCALEIDNATDTSQYTNKFLQGCVNKIHKLKAKKRDWDLQYGCVTQNGRLLCGNRYK